MSTDSVRSMRAPAPLVLLLSLLVLSFAPPPAQAVIGYTVDVKAHPSVFKEHTEVEVPLFLAENRDPSRDTSNFTKYPPGIREVIVDLGSVQSRFLNFTPHTAFDGRGRNNPSAEGFEVYHNSINNNNGRSRLYLRLYATRGAAPVVDGSGITGRTELELGTVRIAVGAHSPPVDGKRVVLSYTVGDDASAIDPMISFWTLLPDAQGDNWRLGNAPGISWPVQTNVFWDGKAENEGLAPGDSGAGGPGTGVPTGGGTTDGGSDPALGPQVPGVSAARYSGGKLKRSKKASKTPFTVLKKKPKKGTPSVKVTVTEKTSLTASLAKVSKKKTTKLKGDRVFEVTSLNTYLKLTGSWNKKTLPKGTYQLTLRSPAGTAQTVEFKVA